MTRWRLPRPWNYCRTPGPFELARRAGEAGKPARSLHGGRIFDLAQLTGDQAKARGAEARTGGDKAAKEQGENERQGDHVG
jgi:hypothetical protein